MKAFILSLRWAGEGIAHAVATQRNMVIHLALGAAAVGLAILLGLSLTEWAVLILTIALVLSAEVFNTALEEIVDHVSPQEHVNAKRAKDAAAGAVLIAACGAAVVGLLLFGPRLWRLVVSGL